MAIRICYQSAASADRSCLAENLCAGRAARAAAVRSCRRCDTCPRVGDIGLGAQPDRTAAGRRSGIVPIAITVVLGLGLLALYALWERFSRNPMTPPWLLGNRPFVVLNVATVLVYTGLAVMFFLL